MFPKDSSEGRQQKDTVKDEAKLPAGYPEKLRQAARAIYHSDRCQEGFSTPSPETIRKRGQEANLNYCQEGTLEEIALGFPVHGGLGNLGPWEVPGVRLLGKSHTGEMGTCSSLMRSLSTAGQHGMQGQSLAPEAWCDSSSNQGPPFLTCGVGVRVTKTVQSTCV